MNSIKRITLTGYVVKYIDLREPKPRTTHEDVYPIDKDALAALGLLGLDIADFITARYERGGYHVTALEQISGKRLIWLDLRKLWAEAPATEECSV